ncbi:MAG: DoxX family membrane protein [Bryobacteraceae bacterium]
MRIPLFAGRILYGGFFLYNGINHFLAWKQMRDYAASKNVTNPGAAVTGTGALLIAGGASILAGYMPKAGLAAVVTFLVGVSPKMHDFWRIEDPDQRTTEMINFSKNMALLGAALCMTAIREPWPLSLPAGQAESERRAGREIEAPEEEIISELAPTRAW